MDMLIEALLEALLYFILLGYMGCFALYLYFKKDRAVKMTTSRNRYHHYRRSVRVKVRRFWKNFYDLSWNMRIGRSTWRGVRIGRFYISYNGVDLILALWGVSNPGQRGPVALSLNHGSRFLMAYITIGRTGFFARSCNNSVPVARPEYEDFKF